MTTGVYIRHIAKAVDKGGGGGGGGVPKDFWETKKNAFKTQQCK